MAFKWTAHPRITIPSRGYLIALRDRKLRAGNGDDMWDVLSKRGHTINDGADAVLALYEEREQQIRREVEDPYRHGWEPEIWRRTDGELEEVTQLLILGGNRSSKTDYCAKRVVQSAMNNPNSIILCFHTDFETSVEVQQTRINHYLPIEYKDRNDVNCKTRFNQRSGFGYQKATFPNGSVIAFLYYSQDYAKVEGREPGAPDPTVANIGVWADELIPFSLYQALRARLATRNAKMLISFTPIKGWSDTVGHFLSGARTTEKAPCPLVPEREWVPRVQQPIKENARVVYFHIEDNPYGGPAQLIDEYKADTMEMRLVKLYGVPTKRMTAVFPKFNPDINVVRHETLPWIKEENYKVTRYISIDPAGGKPWAILWIAVDSAGTWWVYKEFPDVSFGDWAEAGDHGKTKEGPGQQPLGYGILDYVDIIKGDEIFERIIDPRMGAAEKSGKEGSTSIIQELEDEGITAVPAPGLDIHHGLQGINSLLSWNENERLSSFNAPKLYISDRCENLIYAMSHYTARQGLSEPVKDFIDCLRYAHERGLDYIDGKAVGSRGGSY